MTSLAVLSAGLGTPSSSRLLADRLAEATARHLREGGAEVDVVTFELRDLAVDVTNNLLTGFPSPRLADAIERVTTADGLIAVSPIFTTSYSGLFKSFVDVLQPDSITGLPVLMGATGGTERHSLALEYAMRPVFTYLHANPATTAVYAASSDWQTPNLAERIDRAAAEFAAQVRASTRDTSVRDPFALPAGFSPTGGFAAD